MVSLEQLRENGATLRETLPSRKVRLTVPSDLRASDRSALRMRDVREVPAQAVVELSGATVLGREGWVFVDGRLVDGIWQEVGFPARRMLPRGRLEKPAHLGGTTASLLMPWLPNYYHWTTQAVPRVQMVKDVAGDDVDHWLIPADPPSYVLEWLDRLDVPVERRVEVRGRRQVFAVDRLVVSSVPGANRWVPSWVVDHLRKQFPPPPEHGERVFVDRPETDRRRMLNREDVVAALRGRGFRIVDLASLTVQEEAVLFGSAAVVVGVHGAGLTNLVFCRPGTVVLELAPRGLVFPTFAKLADAAQVTHHLLVGTEPALPRPLRFPDVLADVVVDIPALTRLLDPVLTRLG